MNKKEIVQALAIAKSNEDLSAVDDNVMIGYGLKDFKPIHLTLRQVAKVIRWDCIRFNGELDSEEFDDFCRIAKTKFVIVG